MRFNIFTSSSGFSMTYMPGGWSGPSSIILSLLFFTIMIRFGKGRRDNFMVKYGFSLSRGCLIIYTGGKEEPATTFYSSYCIPFFSWEIKRSEEKGSMTVHLRDGSWFPGLPGTRGGAVFKLHLGCDVLSRKWLGFIERREEFFLLEFPHDWPGLFAKQPLRVDVPKGRGIFDALGGLGDMESYSEFKKIN